MSTLQESVSRKFGRAAWDLLVDDKNSSSTRKNIGCAITCNDEIITNMPFEQIMMVAAGAMFADGDEECVVVAKMIHWIIEKTNVLPLVHCHSGFDLVARCLVSIALFKKAMEWRARFRCCPSCGFYRAVGIHTSEVEGMNGIARHFDNWSAFIGKRLGG